MTGLALFPRPLFRPFELRFSNGHGCFPVPRTALQQNGSQIDLAAAVERAKGNRVFAHERRTSQRMQDSALSRRPTGGISFAVGVRPLLCRPGTVSAGEALPG